MDAGADSTTEKAIPEGLSEYLNTARWVSALLVLFTHVNNRAGLPMFGNSGGADILQLGWTFICGFAHNAVVVFFVLSGFLVGGQVLRQVADDRFSGREYMIARISRIHTVLLPVIVLTLLLDAVGSRQSPIVYTIAGNGSPMGNALLLQGFFVETVGSNGPLGTLANEWWYYVTFPLLVLGAVQRRWALLAPGVLVLGITGYLQPAHLVGFVVWIIGAVAAFCPRRRVPRWTQMALVAGFLLMLAAARIGIRGEWLTAPRMAVSDVIVATVFSLTLYALRSKPFVRLPGALARINQAFADFSYSLYAIHVPVVMLGCATALRFTGFGWKTRPVEPWEWAIILGLIVSAITVAYLLSQVTEKHTQTVRRQLRAWTEAKRSVVG
jgi:peptidoglycan/LPS O-acetylase OafA/YrhL